MPVVVPDFESSKVLEVLILIPKLGSKVLEVSILIPRQRTDCLKVD